MGRARAADEKRGEDREKDRPEQAGQQEPPAPGPAATLLTTNVARPGAHLAPADRGASPNPHMVGATLHFSHRTRGVNMSVSASETDKRTYTVQGMTCGHCVAAVSESVAQVPGATDVSVDLDSGLLTVGGEEIDDAAVRAAVEEAGYTLA
jgi:copper chaperone CopZ